MIRTISSAELRKSLTALMDWVARSRRNFLIVEQEGKPIAALLPCAEYERYLAALKDAPISDFEVVVPKHRPIRLASPHLTKPQIAPEMTMTEAV